MTDISATSDHRRRINFTINILKCQTSPQNAKIIIVTMKDTRNVIDKFKGVDEATIIKQLDDENHGLIIAIENTERDFNMGSIVRSANAFGVRDIYVIGRRQWNKRGAMATDKYLRVNYFAELDDFVNEMKFQARKIIVIDNVKGSRPMSQANLPKNSVLVFGQEGPGVSEEMQRVADEILAIEQFGSARSINVGAAAAVAMYEWLRRHVL